MSRLDDAYLLQLITRGGAAMGKSPLMPAQPTLGEAQIRAVITYVRTLSAR